MGRWYRVEDYLRCEGLNKTWDISHWTDEDFQEFLDQPLGDKEGQLENLEEVEVK